jgi:hypothetical protein
MVHQVLHQQPQGGGNPSWTTEIWDLRDGGATKPYPLSRALENATAHPEVVQRARWDVAGPWAAAAASGGGVALSGTDEEGGNGPVGRGGGLRGGGRGSGRDVWRGNGRGARGSWRGGGGGAKRSSSLPASGAFALAHQPDVHHLDQREHGAVCVPSELWHTCFACRGSALEPSCNATMRKYWKVGQCYSQKKRLQQTLPC